MTTSTPNLALTLYNSTTDSAEYFSNFRAVIAGTSLTSNFYKIDTAYGVQAGQITSLQGTRGAVYVPATFISANYYEASGITDITAYSTNMAIILKLDVASAGTVTLNINSLGTKSVTKINSAGTVVNITGAELMIGKNYLFRYDGTQWVWVSSNSADQIYHGGASGNAVLVASDGTPSSSTTTSLLVSNAIFNATEKTTPSDSDTVGISDSDASNVLKKLTWANLKAAIKTYYDSVSATLTNKTLTSPIISTISNTGTLTLPTSTDTLVGRATTDTLENKTIKLTSSLSDGQFSGIVESGTAGATLAFGNLCYFSLVDSRWELADADAEATSGSVKFGMCVLAAASDGSATTILRYGNIRADAVFPVMTIGGVLFAGVTAGEIQTTAPSGAADIIRTIGHANTADELFFNPSSDWFEHV